MGAFKTSFFRELLQQNVAVYGQLLLACRDGARFRGNFDRLEEAALEAAIYLLVLRGQKSEDVPGIEWISGKRLLGLVEDQHLRLQKEDVRLGLVLNVVGLLVLQEGDWRTVGYFVDRFQRDFFELPVFYEVLRVMLLASLEKDALRVGFDRLDVDRLVGNLHSESHQIQLKSLACLQLLSNFRPEVCESWFEAIVRDDGRNSQEHRSFMLCHLVETGARREDLRETIAKVVLSEDVWRLLNECCESPDQLVRKQALSVIKSLIAHQVDKKSTVDSWQSFVTIVEALGESQTHLVLPALPFVRKMDQLKPEWKNSALKLILRHENNAVSGWGINYILKQDSFNDKRQSLERLFLNSLNRTQLFQESNSANQLLSNYYKSPEATTFLLENFKNVPWGSVPFASFLEIIGQLLQNQPTIQNLEEILSSLVDQCSSVKNLNLRSLSALNLSNTIIQLTLSTPTNPPPLDRILLQLETLAKLNASVKLPKLSNWDEFQQRVDGLCFERLLARVRARKDGAELEVLARDVFVPFMRNERTSTERRFGQILDMDVMLAVRLLQHVNLSFSEVDLKAKLTTLLPTFNDDDSKTTLQSVEIYQQLIANPNLIPLLDEILPKLVLLFHKRLNRLNYESLPIAITTQLVRLFCQLGRTDMVDLFLGTFSLEDLVATIRGCNEDKSLHEVVFNALSDVLVQRLKSETVNEAIKTKICQDFPKLIDLGSVQVLYNTLETLVILLAQPTTLKEESLDAFREVINRCYREILIYRKSDHFMKLMARFVRALVAPVKEGDNDQNNAWLKEVVNEYCGMFLYQAVTIGGLANLLFEKLLQLPVAALLDWNPFARFLLVGLLLGEGQKREQRIEDEFCAAKALTTPLFTTPTQLQSDARVRVMCVLFLYRLASTNHPDATLFLLKLERMLIERFQQISKAKERYYADSQTHRHKLRIVQALCVLLKLTGTHPYPLLEVVLYETNQPNINYLIELILADSSIDTLTIINSLRADKVKVSGVQSVFVVLWLRCCKTNYLDVEYINFLLPWTMAQNFSTRLYAQITIAKLIEKFYDKPEAGPFGNIHAAINSYLKQGNVEKNLEKCMKDFRFNRVFDYANLLTLENVFHNIPRVSGMAAEDVVGTRVLGECFASLQLERVNLGEAIEFGELAVEKRENLFLSSGFGGADHIQKKIVPLKAVEPGRELLGDLPERLRLRKAKEDGLIVVASLVDRAPNLGGLARSSEIFGVRQYVVGSLKDVESKEFQALSMTAEKWLNVAELKSFQLVDYLREMKAKGYAIVGAEQTTGSRPIQQIRFPARAVLVLGHEKEGLPAHIISQLDIVAEIPQFGVVRSLNVHVTGAIFMWEYARQHLVMEGS
uniref:Probable methyltransferase TARBP1 n=1 Tax=Culex pipiens TaxID=7175 RepID=A0A8D8F103_CULPI